jgi:flagellar basal-body rod protein FlgB
MKVSSYKNEIISENIANVDTPNYKAKKVEFDEIMGAYMGSKNKMPLMKTDGKHFPASDEVINMDNFARNQNNPSLRNDGNDVNLDYEMTELAANSIQYSMFSQITSMEIIRLKSAIAGR